MVSRMVMEKEHSVCVSTKETLYLMELTAEAGATTLQETSDTSAQKHGRRDRTEV